MVTGTKDDIAILPLTQGSQFRLFSSSVDYVGNREPLAASMQDFVDLDFPVILATCANNCSNHGNCTVFGDCICEEGFYGENCSEGKHF